MTSPWTNDREEEFVALIEGKPELFDNTEMNFTNKTAKMNAWLELAEHFHISEKELRKRWDSLRTQYSRYTKMYASGSADGRLCTARQQWILQRLKFLDPHIKRRSSYCTDLDYEVMVVENSCDELSPAQVDVELEADGMSTVLLHRPVCSDSEQSADTTRLQLPRRPYQDTEKRSSDSPPYQSSKRACERDPRGPERPEPQGLLSRAAGRESVERVEREVDSASPQTHSRSPVADTDDRWDAFGRYVASCLRSLESCSSRTQAQDELCAILQRHMERAGEGDATERKNRSVSACTSCRASTVPPRTHTQREPSALVFQDDLEPFLKSMAIVIQRLPEGVRAEVKFRVHELVHRAQMKHLYEHTNTQTAPAANQVSTWENGLNYNLI
ncbi:uncharacterized protein LOC113584825 [Electrophorus electricus]|uniref:uncharacterized protein LOC113584825 n=1 Tax=Electrophorus electricus TaxID=8005 RepID=UPI0015D07711|nr:uncharacterized protein LOC113584825 [Electrophorus electricus]XP_026877803.2 uncharacterized protein LOC113584825 [Electrophorus electricus]